MTQQIDPRLAGGFVQANRDLGNPADPRVLAAQAAWRRRRLRRRVWDVVTVLVVAVMLFASGYLIGHAHSRVVHRVEILYAV